jgi:hypothetical protein
MMQKAFMSVDADSSPMRRAPVRGTLDRPETPAMATPAEGVVPTTAAAVLQLQRSAGNAAVADLLMRRRSPPLDAAGRSGRSGEPSRLSLQRTPATAAARGAVALGKRLLRSGGIRGSQMLYRAAGRRALARLQKFGIDKSVAAHIAEHFVMIPEKVAHSVFVQSLRSTKAVTGLVTETLKKGANAPILSATDSGALAWVIEAELGRTIGHAGKQALTKMRVVVDLRGRLITAFPVRSFLPAMTMRGLGGLKVTLSGALTIIAVQGVYEDEAAAATKAREAFDEANEPSWWEYLLPWGPSSTMGYEPNLGAIRERAEAAAESIEKELGEPLDAEARAGVEDDVMSIWR